MSGRVDRAIRTGIVTLEGDHSDVVAHRRPLPQRQEPQGSAVCPGAPDPTLVGWCHGRYRQPVRPECMDTP